VSKTINFGIKKDAKLQLAELKETQVSTVSHSYLLQLIKGS